MKVTCILRWNKLYFLQTRLVGGSTKYEKPVFISKLKQAALPFLEFCRIILCQDTLKRWLYLSVLFVQVKKKSFNKDLQEFCQ